MLRGVPQIVSLYRIPTYVATGQRRFESVRAQPVGIDRLRLAAARARAQVVLVLDYGYQSAYRANGLAFLGVALVPLFFVPLQDVEAESYLDAYVVDTRNGYFYGQLSAARRQSDRFHTLYSNGAERLVELQRSDMLAQIGKDLGALFSEQRTASRAPDWGLDAPLPAKPFPARGTELSVDTTDPWADSRTVPIELTLDGKVAVGQERTQTLAEFVGRLRKLAQEGPVRVVVTADKRLPYGRVAEVIALVREVGVKAVVLGGEPGDAAAPVEPKLPEPKAAEPKPQPKPVESKPPQTKQPKPYAPKRL
jgi:hypothetical protein